MSLCPKLHPRRSLLFPQSLILIFYFEYCVYIRWISRNIGLRQSIKWESLIEGNLRWIYEFIPLRKCQPCMQLCQLRNIAKLRKMRGKRAFLCWTFSSKICCYFCFLNSLDKFLWMLFIQFLIKFETFFFNQFFGS